MTEQRILYERGDGTVGLLFPCPSAGLTIEDIAQKDIPAGRSYAIVDAAAIPSDMTYYAAWTADLDADPVVVTLDPSKKSAIDAALATQRLEQWFADSLQEGFVTEYGWKLGLMPSDVTLLTGQFVLAKEAAALNLPLPPVVDTTGIAHALSIADLTSLMLAYGQHRAALSSEYARRKADL